MLRFYFILLSTLPHACALLPPLPAAASSRHDCRLLDRTCVCLFVCVCVCVNVHVSAKAGQRHAPIEKEGSQGGGGLLGDVWPGSWELLCSFVPL